MFHRNSTQANRHHRRSSFICCLLAHLVLIAVTGCAEESSDTTTTTGLNSIEVVSLEMQRGDGPAYLNERIPVTLTVRGTSADPSNPVTQLVPVMVSFVDPNDPESETRGCSSSSILVEVEGNGEPQTISTFIWPTSVCASLVGSPAVLMAEVIEADDMQVSTSKLFNDEIILEASALVDIEYAGLVSESSVAVFPAVNTAGNDIDGAANEALASSITVRSNLVINGRDPYIAPVNPDLIPEELKQSDHDLVQDLRFGKDPSAVGELDDLPGKLTLRYEISAASDGETWAPMTIGTPNGRVATVEVTELRPGLPNVLSHDLFLEEEARSAITDPERWLGEESYLIRGCFVTDFEQFHGDSGADGRCQSIPVVLIANDGVESGLTSLSFDGGRSASFGNSRIGLDAVLETHNAMNSSGVFSDTEARLTLKGKIGRSFSFDLVHGFATLDAPLQGDKSIDMGLTLLGENLASFNETLPGSLVVEKDFSFSRDVLIVKATFGFGPVGLNFDLRGGGQAGVNVSGEASLGLSEADCRPHLPAATPEAVLARADQIANIEAQLATIEQRVSELPPLIQHATRIVLTALLLGQLRDLGELVTDEIALNKCVVLEAAATPSANLTAAAFGGIDIRIARAGVEIDLDLAKLELPATATLALGLDDDNRLLIAGGAGLDLEFTPLAGRVALVGRVGIGRFSKSKSVTIVSFSTSTISTNLLSRQMDVAEVIIP